MYRSLGGIPKKSFTNRPIDQSPYIAFFAANLMEAIDKTGEVPVIDFSKLKVSSGILPMVSVPTAVTGATGITLSYITDSLLPDVSASDEVFALAKLKTGQLITARQVRGNEPLASILLPYPDIAASAVECCYLFVYNEDESMSSESTYVEVG